MTLTFFLVPFHLKFPIYMIICFLIHVFGVGFISKKHPYGCQYLQKKKTPWRTHKIYVTKEGESVINGAGKKGTIAGAVALIVGTSIGSGILALPQKASPAVNCSQYILIFFFFFSFC